MYKRINIIMIFIILFTFGCKERKVSIEFKNNYVGPCIIFIVPEDKIINNCEKIKMENGIGLISKKMENSILNFTINENKIEIIPIKENYTNSDKEVHIYELVKTSANISCPKNNILDFYEFYIGTQNDFIKWRKINTDCQEYFFSKGVNFCSFYE